MAHDLAPVFEAIVTSHESLSTECVEADVDGLVLAIVPQS
jgi:hypothetical protein